MTDRPENRYSEIELAEIFRIIWKWKYLILLGTVISVVVAVVISMTMPKYYRTAMVLQANTMGLDIRGKKIQIDSAVNIKALIEAGAFNNDIRIHIKKTHGEKTPLSSKFKVTIPRRSNVMKISYDSSVPEIGNEVLTILPQLIVNQYKEIIRQIEEEHKEEIREKNKEIIEFHAKENLIKSNIRNINKRLKQLEEELKVVNDYNEFLMQKREILNSDRSQNTLNAAILYSNAIQQNLDLMNKLKEQISGYMKQLDDAKSDLEMVGGDIEIINKEIQEIKDKISRTEYLNILQPPSANQRPIKPNLRLNVFLATIVGFIVMLLLFFVVEGIRKFKAEK
jgi:uncharacterized protein involved in exopolysaccharide biosynthesis